MSDEIYEPGVQPIVDIVEKAGVVKKDFVAPERKIGDEVVSNNSIKSADLVKDKIPVKLDASFKMDKKDYSKRVPTGIKGFDDLIEGGFERDSIVLIIGTAGTGKTLLSMQFLYEGVTKFNENSIFISFEEGKDSLYEHALQFGWDFEKLDKEDKFRLLFFKPHQVTKILEEGGGQIRDALSEINAKRVVVDSITAYGLLFRDEYTRREKILEFFNLLSRWGITSLVVAEESPKNVENGEGSIAFISDAVIAMNYNQDSEKDTRVHSLEIIKMRGTRHTNKVCAIGFDDDGLRVYPDVEVF
ncbi:MAG: ATPase domain-containing protein [archaeon]|jgi:circadian clock protein KaiC